jgi:thymidylate synthase
MRFSLLDNKFPLITTKKTYFRAIVEELLWFISGSTNAKVLSNKKIGIWDANSSREFLDKYGFTEREEGDVGPCYSFQWRHFGADYRNMNDSYGGFDQIKHIINLLKADPMSRRIILTAWNPVQISEMSLPPCHILAQFYVHYKDDKGYLSCQMYQRSADIGLGVPFNIASYSLLTILLAKCTGLVPYEFIHVMGDTHIYSNHIEAMKMQIERKPYKFPKLFVKEKNNYDIFEFKYEDLILDNYNYHEPIKMDMVA